MSSPLVAFRMAQQKNIASFRTADEPYVIPGDVEVAAVACRRIEGGPVAQESSMDSSSTPDRRRSPGIASYGPDGGSFVRLPEPRGSVEEGIGVRPCSARSGGARARPWSTHTRGPPRSWRSLSYAHRRCHGACSISLAISSSYSGSSKSNRLRK